MLPASSRLNAATGLGTTFEIRLAVVPMVLNSSS
jgi:hypothetical protein